jgi:hypothetical protein
MTGLGAIIGHPIRADIEWSVEARPRVTALALCAMPPGPPVRKIAGYGRIGISGP